MPTKRVDLPGGDWVDLVTRLNHAQARRIRRTDYSPDGDTQTETVAAMVAGWSLHGVDGAELPYPGGGPEGLPSEALDLIPYDVMTTVFVACADVINPAKSNPKGGPGTSGGSSSGGRRSGSTKS